MNDIMSWLGFSSISWGNLSFGSVIGIVLGMVIKDWLWSRIKKRFFQFVEWKRKQVINIKGMMNPRR